MKTIWICGDSWSVPNYEAPVVGYRTKYHTAEILADQGYHILNFGRPGQGNYISVNSMESHVNHSKWPDFILWFHTAVFRDCYSIQTPEPMNERMPIVAHDIYTRYQRILEHTGAKLVVIDGHAPVYQPVFNQIIKPDLHIENWRGQILGIPDLPQSHWYSQAGELSTQTSYSTEQIETEVHKLEQIVDAIGARPDLFPDLTHPGDLAHMQLALDLIEYFRASVAHR